MVEQAVVRAPSTKSEPPLPVRLLSLGYGLLIVLGLAGYVAFDYMTNDAPAEARASRVDRRQPRAAQPPAYAVGLPDQASVFLICDPARASELNLALARTGVDAVVLVDGDPSRTEARHVLAGMQARGLVAVIVYDDCLSPPPVEELLRVIKPAGG
jgi:hypothetical protein